MTMYLLNLNRFDIKFDDKNDIGMTIIDCWFL